MRKATVLIFLIGLSVLGLAQTEYTEQQMKEKLDSILAEGNLLYKYEKAAWISTDLAMEKREVREKFNGYLIYQVNDTIKAIILGKSNDCIYEFSFVDNFSKPDSKSLTNRELSDYESKLLAIKTKIIDQVVDKKYEVVVPEGYNLNFVLIPIETGYKFYILTGTAQSQVIPFGNDYLFLTNLKGKIISNRKFHSKLIPVITEDDDGRKISETTHSHLRTEPFISATDICTFKLYASLYGLDEFKVYSPALSAYFTYSLTDDEITFELK